MAYVKTAWVDEVTPVSAANLNKLEQGVADAHYPPLVTALPATPSDGQLIYYRADPANGVAWMLRYCGTTDGVTVNPSAYKWEFVGGGSLVVYQSRSNITRSGGYVSTPDDGGGALPAITVPFAGDYDLEYSATELYDSNAATAVYYSPKVGAAAASDNDGLEGPSAGQTATPGAAVRRKTGLTAATVIQMQIREQPGGQGGAARISHPWLRVTPVRVG